VSRKGTRDINAFFNLRYVLIHRAYTALRPLNSAVANDDIINDGSFTRD